MDVLREIRALEGIRKERTYLGDVLSEAGKEIDSLREALRPFADVLAVYKGFSEHQLILLSEDNPKGRRLAHLLPDHFEKAASAMIQDEGE